MFSAWHSKFYFHKCTPLHTCHEPAELLTFPTCPISSQLSSSSSCAWKVPPDPHHWVYKSHYPFKSHLNSGKHSETSREFSLSPKAFNQEQNGGKGPLGPTVSNYNSASISLEIPRGPRGWTDHRFGLEVKQIRPRDQLNVAS